MEESLFLKVLKSNKFIPDYTEATEKQKTILIPPDDDFNLFIKNSPSKIKYFINSHIISPSPFLLGEFMNKNGQILHEEEKKYATGKGFKKKIEIKKIKQETFYNSDFDPFQVIKIDKCAIEDYEKYIVVKIENEKEDIYMPNSIEEFNEYLFSIEKILFQSLIKYVQDFNKSYILLSGFKTQGIEKINKYYEESVENFTLIDEKFEEKKHLEILKICVHSALFYGIYDKLMKFYNSIFKNEDVEMHNCIYTLKNVNLSHFKVEKEFICDYSESSNILSKLNNFKTIYEKLKCLESSINEIDKKLNEKRSIFEIKDRNMLTSDELIPIFAYIIVKTDFSTFRSNLEIMKDYQTEEMSSSEKGYCLTTLEAALELVKNEAKKIGIKVRKKQPELIFQEKKEQQATKVIKINKKEDKTTNNQPERLEKIPTAKEMRISKSISLRGAPSQDIGGLVDLLDSDDDVID
eukprot:gene1156-10670_t